MVAARHNLTRRALLGVGVGACAPLCVSGRGAGLGGRPGALLRPRWDRALASLRRAEARLAGFKAAERQLPAQRRAFPACKDLEERFGRLDDLRYAALRRLLRTPAPDLPAIALKLELAVAERAWELSGAEDCLAGLVADARRLSETKSV